ncbi:MAG: hypothetical protein IH987_18855, partial [Planctomycetes bacterium]|nr:hypothetical protein [Planctomycetota bacterium]
MDHENHDIPVPPVPDWSYQTVFRPLLFRLGARLGRRTALGCMGFLARLPFGKHAIQLMGHMKPDARLAIERNGIKLPSRVGLGSAVDPFLSATPALAELGFGFLEVGPIVANPAARGGAIRVDGANETLHFELPREALTPKAASQRLERDRPFRQPVFARIEPSSPEEAREMLNVLGDCVDGFVVPINLLEVVRELFDIETTGSDPQQLLFTAIDASAWRDDAHRERCTQAHRDGWLAGVIVVGETEEGAAQSIGKPGFAAGVETVRLVRAELGDEPIVIGAVGVHAPSDALDYVEA